MGGARTPPANVQVEDSRMATAMKPQLAVLNQADAPPDPEQIYNAAGGNCRAEQLLGLPVHRHRWTKTVQITPEQAKYLLLTMSKKQPQRRLRPAKVRQYAEMMRAGHFLTTHQGLSFNTRGELDDGQHRLQGCVDANVIISIDCTFNQPDNHFVADDRGAARSIGDDLTIQGLIEPGPKAAGLQAAARLLWCLDNELPPWAELAKARFDTVEAGKTINRHPKLISSVDLVYGYRRRLRALQPGAFAGLLTIFREVNEDDAQTFAMQVLTGEDLREGQPALVLRETLARSVSRTSAGERARFCTRVIHSWNAFRRGNRIMKLMGSPLTSEPLPKIHGYKAA
jgi:hypothetical protein